MSKRPRESAGSGWLWGAVTPVLLIAALAGCAPAGDGETFTIEGDWVIRRAWAPHTNVYEFAPGGVGAVYGDYACTIQTDTAAWSGSDDTFTLDFGDGAYVFTLQWVDANQVQLVDPTEGTGTLYRKGFEPDGAALSLTPQVLAGYDWVEDELARGEVRLYSYTATLDSTHWLEWQDNGDGSSTLDIQVTVYDEDGSTILVEEQDDPAAAVGLVTGQTIYVLVESIDDPFDSGIYSLMIHWGM